VREEALLEASAMGCTRGGNVRARSKPVPSNGLVERGLVQLAGVTPSMPSHAPGPAWDAVGTQRPRRRALRCSGGGVQGRGRC